MRRMRWAALVGTAGILALGLAACAPDEQQDEAEPAPAEQAAPAPAPETAAPAAGATGAVPAGATPEMVTQGQQLFTSSGNCFTCHGQNAEGTQLAPALNDQTWVNVDGSYDAIVNLVKTGVPTPKQAPAPMPPMGGAQLSDDQVRALAAYVYSISHGS